jgi:hypothetical protein
MASAMRPAAEGVMNITDCSELLPWLAVLVLLNAVEIMLLIGVTLRLRSARDTVMDAVEARLLEVEKEGIY